MLPSNVYDTPITIRNSLFMSQPEIGLQTVSFTPSPKGLGCGEDRGALRRLRTKDGSIPKRSNHGESAFRLAHTISQQQ